MVVVMRVAVTRGGSDREVWSGVLWQRRSSWEATCVHVLERMCALVACHFFFLSGRMSVRRRERGGREE